MLPSVLPINNIPEIKEKQKQKPLKTKQTNLLLVLQKITQENAERELVELFASHVENEIVQVLAGWYDQTQSQATARPYKHFSTPMEFAETLGYSMMDVTAALSNLDDKGWVYTVPPKQDKYGRWKIGFTEEFLEKVKQR